jgi:hypothetical protein
VSLRKWIIIFGLAGLFTPWNILGGGCLGPSLLGCMSDGRGWRLSGGSGDWHVGYENLEKAPGRNYTFRQTFDAEGMAIMTSAVKNLQSDAAVVCDDSTGICIISARKSITNDQWLELLRTIPHNPEAVAEEESNPNP